MKLTRPKSSWEIRAEQAEASLSVLKAENGRLLAQKVNTALRLSKLLGVTADEDGASFEEVIGARTKELSVLREQVEWKPIETAPKDRPVLLLCGERQYVAKWREGWDTWGVSVRESDGRESSFHDVGRRVMFETHVVDPGPSHWMDLPASSTLQPNPSDQERGKS